MFQLNICMKKFEQALLGAEKQNNLKRVKLKLDPKIREAQDYSQYEGYEGYVLSETETHVEIQIKDNRIVLPKIVLENRLKDFLRGVAPKTYNAAEQLGDRFEDAKKYYLKDPNVTGAEKAGRMVGGLAKAGLKVANPMNILKGIERVATAPTRFVGGALGVDTDHNKKIKDFGSQITLIYTNEQQSVIGQLLINAASKLSSTGHTHSGTADQLSYYTVADIDDASAKQTYIVIGAEMVAQFPGNRVYTKQRIPIGSTPQFTNKIKSDIAAINKVGSSVLDVQFFESLKQVSVQIKDEITKLGVDKKHQLVLTVLHVPSLKTFEAGGMLTQKNRNGDFTLSEKYT